MDLSRPQDLECEVEMKCTSPEMSSKVSVREHPKLELKDSGFESDSSASPSSRLTSAKKQKRTPVIDTLKDNSDTQGSKEVNNHPKLKRTPSVLHPVDSSQHSTTAASSFRTSTVISCASLSSNTSKHHPPGFTAAERPGDGLLKPPESSDLYVKSNSMECVGTFKEKTLNTGLGEDRADSDQDSFDSMETSNGQQEDDTSCDSLSSNSSDTDQPSDCRLPEPSEVSRLEEARDKLKEEYNNRMKLMFVEPEKCNVLLKDIYTEPCITQEEAFEEEEKEEKEQSAEDECPVRETGELKAAPRPARLKVFPFKWNIFNQPPEGKRKIKTVLTKGIPGIVKTVCVQKFVLDWAEGKTHQEIDVILALSLQSLNLKKDQNVSLNELLHHFFPQIKQIQLNTARVMLIFDGLDEYRLPLDFQHNPNCSDPSEPTAVDVLLTNLIRGNLLPSALLWITSRPEAANTIPSEYLQSVTEIQGFTDTQREEYLYKRISDKTKASKIISHIKTSEYLRRLCHIPAYCSLLVAVLQETLNNTRAPQTLVEILKRSFRANLHSKDHAE
ncbi:NACHT, LRR and PYD domains-containing protein 3-like [Astyanax mexicanus]|uniref:NACHT, LRR and PYD domains-containing protein 3-like n=1 Tax=Astyanax mexicanus TaxID=7994 RepID=UPI0020CB0522|nr:NACHT, LRR and PYD domains-containing protein 3-like [Astyanax mexicanus]